MGRRWAAVLLLLTVTGCSTGGPGSPNAGAPTNTPSAVQSTSPTPAATAETPAPRSTKRFDSIAVIGHSGATGTVSDPRNPFRDANENSWATGDNPKVESIYQRLLATRPAMKGHNYNGAVGGSTVHDLADQIDSVVAGAEVLPDLVLMQTMDNDIRCDGTDDGNYRPFGRTLDRALSRIERTMPGARVFLVSQWASVEVWTSWAAHIPAQVQANSGTGPCDVFDAEGRPRPAGIASLEAIVGNYWAQVERACNRHAGCFTDAGALHDRFVPTDADLSTVDYNHLSIAGHAKFAAIAWEALPDAIKRAR